MPTIDERVTSVLTFVQKLARENPDIVYGNGSEGTNDSPHARQFCRKVASDGIVLLKNEQGILPLSGKSVKKVAVIGPHAHARVISGGGSAALKASYVVTPWEGLLQNAPTGIDFEYEVGCYGRCLYIPSISPALTNLIIAHKYLPTLENNLVTPDGKPGWLCTFYNQDAQGNPTEEKGSFVLQDTRVKLNDFLPAGLTKAWTIKLRGILTMERSTSYELGLTVAGKFISCQKITVSP